MANYKVVDADQLDADLETVADAIREKTGRQERISFPDEFVSEIEGIEAGIGGGDDQLNALIARSIQQVDSTATGVGNYSFYQCTNLTSARFANATSIGNYSFYNCTKLPTVEAPLMKTIGSYGLASCIKLTSVDYPVATTLGTYALSGCTSLTDVYLPMLTSLGTSSFRGCTKLARIDLPKASTVAGTSFYGCTALEIADFGGAKSVGAQAFYNCYKLKALVLRYSDVATLANINAFTNCYWLKGTTNTTYNPTGGRGYVYVPRELMGSGTLLGAYERATNWISAGVQFRALEDYTLDGTVFGDLDTEKMLAALEGGGSGGGSGGEIM